MRINQYLANCGIGSRRHVEEYIKNQLVSVNDNVVLSLSTNVDENNDIVKFKGEILSPHKDLIYIMLNKPKGYICSVKDEKDRPTVMKLIKETGRIYPVGRLDYNTEGLLLLTNDGNFTNEVLHPSKHINKTYEVYLKNKPKSDELDLIRKGMMIEGVKTLPAIVTAPRGDNGLYKLNITIFEGKNREVRKMFESIGYKVFSLKRIAIGKLLLGNLPTKKYKLLTKSELELIFN